MVDEKGRANAAADLESSAALLRADSAELDAMLHALVEKLAGVPGLSTVVTYRDGRLRRVIGDLPYINDLRRKSDPIRTIAITVGSCEYWVRAAKGSVQSGTVSVSSKKGKVTDILTLPEWAEALLIDITRQTHINHEAINALRDLIELDRT